MSNDMNKPPAPQKPLVMPTKFGSELVLKDIIAKHYMKQIENFFGDKKKSMAFLSGIVASTQRLPELMECTPVSVIGSFMTMAQLGFMPSGVSGEAYVLPYKRGNVLEAQFQLGYQGLVTLFYRAGARDVAAEIVYENDKFEYVNGRVNHTPDVFSDDRGKAKGAYVIVRLANGGEVSKVMSAKEILAIGEKFSKSWSSKFSPWDAKNDPQLWMWKKTVLKQVAKLVPKNETILNAIAEDNKDSIISDRLEGAMHASTGLETGNLLKDGNNKKEAEPNGPGEEDQTPQGTGDADGDQTPGVGE